MSYSASIDQEMIRQWITQKLTIEAIEEKLKEKGLDAASITEHIREFRRLRNESRRFIGFICMGGGAFLGFVSCVLTIINPAPDMYHWFLYGLTTIAICVVMYGLYLVFE